MSFFIEKEVECNFNFDYEKVAEAVVSASLEHESFPYEAEVTQILPIVISFTPNFVSPARASPLNFSNTLLYFSSDKCKHSP